MSLLVTLAIKFNFLFRHGKWKIVCDNNYVVILILLEIIMIIMIIRNMKPNIHDILIYEPQNITPYKLF